MNQAIKDVLRYFKYDHLPKQLQEVSKPFCELANKVAEAYPDSRETTICLRKLLEAKDSAVRASLPEETPTEAAKRGYNDNR